MAVVEGDHPRRIGPYELLEPLGRGAMGTVFRARHVQLDRLVALKLLGGEGALARETLARFRREARLLAELDHPGIVKVLDAASEGDRHYIAMELVQGRSLASLIEGETPAVERVLSWMAAIAGAVAHAHARGLVHRDLKPANILIDALDRPRVVDFGLGRELEDSTRLTRTEQIMGTPYYLPPERLGLGVERGAAPTADVYSLGVMFYELLTGGRPFEAQSPTRLMHAILHDHPPAPRRIDGRIPEAAQAICLKAMARRPGDRYPDAGALADDLERLLRLEDVRVRSPSLVRRLGRLGRERPLATVLVLLILSALPLTAAAKALLRHHDQGQRLQQGRRWCGRAQAELRDGRWLAAAEGFAQALLLQSDHPEARTGRARALLALADEALAAAQPGLARLLLRTLELEQPDAAGLAARLAQAEADQAAQADAVDRALSEVLGNLPQGLSEDQRRRHFARLVSLRHAHMVERLIDGLTHSHPDLRELSARALRYHADRRAVAPLLARLPQARPSGDFELRETDQAVVLAVAEALFDLDRDDAAFGRALLWCEACFPSLVPHLSPLIAGLPSPPLPAGNDPAARAAALMDQAKIQAERGDVAGALALCDAAIASAPSLPGPYNERGSIRHRLDQDQAALRDYDQAVVLAPDLLSVRLNRAAVLRELQRWPEALADLDFILRRPSEHSRTALALRGEVQLKLGRPDLARADLEQALAQAPDEVLLNFQIGSIYALFPQGTGEERALALYGRALELDPRYVLALVYRADLHLRAGRLEAARADADRALDLDPGCAPALLLRGDIHRRQGAWEAALADVERCAPAADAPTAAGPWAGHFDFAQAHVQRAQVLLELNRLADALQAAERAAALAPRSALAHFTLGEVQRRRGALLAAEAAYSHCIACDAGIALAYYQRAQLRLNRGIVTPAELADLERACSLAPGDLNSRSTYIQTLARLGRPQEAEEALARLEDQAPGATVVHRLRGEIALLGGRPAEALSAFDLYVAAPQEEADIVANVWNGRGFCLQQLGRMDEALESFTRAVQIAPTLVAAHQNRVAALAALGRYPEALSALDLAEFYGGVTETTRALREALRKHLDADPPSGR